MRPDALRSCPRDRMPGDVLLSGRPPLIERPRGRFGSISAKTLPTDLEAFYCNLGFDDRRRRFRAGISDASIRAYCAALDSRRCFAIDFVHDDLRRAVLEVHALDDGFDRAELTLTCVAVVEPLHVAAHLVQLAAFQAAARGCRRLVAEIADCSSVLLEALRDVAEVEPASRTIQYDLRPYTFCESDEDRAAVPYG